jgi:hypothetical protein
MRTRVNKEFNTRKRKEKVMTSSHILIKKRYYAGPLLIDELANPCFFRATLSPTPIQLVGHGEVACCAARVRLTAAALLSISPPSRHHRVRPSVTHPSID